MCALASVWGVLLFRDTRANAPNPAYLHRELQFGSVDDARRAIELLGRADWILARDHEPVACSPSIDWARRELARVPFTAWWAERVVAAKLHGVRGFEFGPADRPARLRYLVNPAGYWHNRGLGCLIEAVVDRPVNGRWQTVSRIVTGNFISRTGVLSRSGFIRLHGEADHLYRDTKHATGGLLMRIADDVGHIITELGGRQTPPHKLIPAGGGWLPGSAKGRELMKALKAGATAADEIRMLAPGSWSPSANWRPGAFRALFGSDGFDRPCLSGCSGSLAVSRAASARQGLDGAFDALLAPELRGIGCDCKLLQAALLHHVPMEHGSGTWVCTNHLPGGALSLEPHSGHDGVFFVACSLEHEELGILRQVARTLLNPSWAIFPRDAQPLYGVRHVRTAIETCPALAGQAELDH